MEELEVQFLHWLLGQEAVIMKGGCVGWPEGSGTHPQSPFLPDLHPIWMRAEVRLWHEPSEPHDLTQCFPLTPSCLMRPYSPTVAQP